MPGSGCSGNTPRLLVSLIAGVMDPSTAEGGDDRVDDRAPAYVAFTRRTVRSNFSDKETRTHTPGEDAWQSRRVALYTSASEVATAAGAATATTTATAACSAG